jgi:hypothetical protein
LLPWLQLGIRTINAEVLPAGKADKVQVRDFTEREQLCWYAVRRKLGVGMHAAGGQGGHSAGK